MNKHTPGPWAPGHPDQDNDRHVVCSLSEGWSVVALQADPAKYDPEADARLIAAAPELLEEAEKLIDLHVKAMNGEQSDLVQWDSAVLNLRSAIAKAKGEQE